MPPEEVRSGRQAGACQRDAQCQGAFLSAKNRMCSCQAKVLISDTKCGIERNDFFIVIKAEVFGRELDCIGGLVGVHIDL